MYSNNDGMDPNWRPAPGPELISDPLQKLKDLIKACEPFAKSAAKVPKEKPVNGVLTIHSYSISAASSAWNEFSEAYEKVKFK